MDVINEIRAERARQVTEEGWTPEHDDDHAGGEMAKAAACYAANAAGLTIDRNPWWAAWPWSLAWWKPKTPRRDLIRAAALIVAEIERLDRRDGSAPDARQAGRG